MPVPAVPVAAARAPARRWLFWPAERATADSMNDTRARDARRVLVPHAHACAKMAQADMLMLLEQLEQHEPASACNQMLLVGAARTWERGRSERAVPCLPA